MSIHDEFKDLLDQFEGMMAKADAFKADVEREERIDTLWPVVFDDRTVPRTITVLDQPDIPDSGWATKTLNRAQRAMTKAGGTGYAAIHGDTYQDAVTNAQRSFG